MILYFSRISYPNGTLQDIYLCEHTFIFVRGKKNRFNALLVSNKNFLRQFYSIFPRDPTVFIFKQLRMIWLSPWSICRSQWTVSSDNHLPCLPEFRQGVLCQIGMILHLKKINYYLLRKKNTCAVH